jgi:hypothetical protein
MVAAAEAPTVWVSAPPSDQETKVYVFEPFFCCGAVTVLAEPTITVRVDGDSAPSGLTPQQAAHHEVQPAPATLPAPDCQRHGRYSRLRR